MLLPSPSQRRRRSGFTLIELLMVVVIIGILVALLIPAVQGVIRRAREAAVSAEINTLASSNEAFKTTYGDYPPGRLLLMENGNYSIAVASTTTSLDSATTTYFGTSAANYPDSSATSLTDLSEEQLAARSLRYMRKFFPRAVFSTTGATGVLHDFNGDGSMAGSPLLLQGHECLVFGGIPSSANVITGGFAPVGMSGFARNPLNPFQNDVNALNRSTPLFEFKGNRLADDDQDGMPGYVDSLATGADARYYAYFSAYGNNGYDPNDVNVAGETATLFTYRVNFSSVNSVSGAPNPYTTSAAVPATGPTAYIKPQSFQILSPGHDRLYGAGGQYNASSNGAHLTPYSGIDRTAERDNLTNLNNGPLE